MFLERDTPTPLEVLITSFIFISLFYYVRANRAKSSKTVVLYSAIGCILFCLFDYCDGDFFHYKEHFGNIKKGYDSPFEMIYNWIISISWNYYFFRFIVWGTSIWIVKLTVQRLRINDSNFWYLFVIYSLLLFAYARVSLALALSTFGFVIILTAKPKRVFEYCFGLSLIVFSAFFHKSILIVLLLIPLSFLKLGRKSIIIGVCLLPLLIHFVNNYLIFHLMTVDLGEVQQSAVTSYILNSDGVEEGGTARKILDILEQLPTYFCALLFVILFKDYSELNQYQKRLYPLLRWSILIILCSSCFILFPYTKVLYYRIMYLARVPAVIGISLMYRNNLISRRNMAVFCGLAIMNDFATLSYSLYLSIIK